VRAGVDRVDGVLVLAQLDGTLPAARTIEKGVDRWWFGVVVGSDVDPTRGTLMPYLENNRAVLKCPNVSRTRVQQKYNGGTGGYGDKYAYLAPLSYPAPAYQPVWRKVNIGHVRETSNTVAFADTVGTWFTSWPPSGDPILIEVPLMEPPSGQYPTVHFRHTQTANVCFLDGHVEAINPGTRNPAPSWEPASATQLRDLRNVFDLGTTDELWDRE